MSNLFDNIKEARVVVNHWNRSGPWAEWYVEDRNHFSIPGFRNSYPSPRLARKAIVAKGYRLIEDEHAYTLDMEVA